MSAGVPGSFIGSLVLQSLVSVLDHAAFAETPKQMECLDECLGDMMLLIDRTLGRNETPIARRWRVVRLTRWLVAAAVLIASMITTRVMNENTAPWSGVVAIASIQAFCAFGVVHLFGLAIMPDRFFLLEPRGKKALARTGVRNINAMRMLVIFVGLLAITLFLCAGLPVIGFI